MGREEPIDVVELRILDGPNLYFTRPAVKLTVSVLGWLDAPEARVAAVAAEARLSGAEPGRASGSRVRPGHPGSEQRHRFIARLAAHFTRTLAEATGTNLAVRARPGPEAGQIVVAFPWRHRNAAEALAREVADLLGAALDARGSFSKMVAAAAERLAMVVPGAPPPVVNPSISVIAVSGTNGKTTTVRLLSHIGRTAGKRVAYSSTDGVYVDDERVEEGDYSGFGGASQALSQPGIDLAVLETARGGILLRGIGTLHNDVAVVTNISADHLDLLGIRTLDQLAEVKATITRITRPTGWDVLNADDPRVLAMRRGARGRPWLFSLDPDHPAIRVALAEGGRATTVIDGRLTYLTDRGRARPLLPLEDIPITLAGISSHNIQNAMAATSAALGVGLPEKAVVRGLETFVLDPETNPGRTNLFELDGRVIVADYAHNEAGLQALLQTCRGLCPPGAEIWLAFCTAGDRTNEILHGLGYVAARGADHVAIAELLHYLRGRDRQDLVERLRAGALDGGAAEVPVFDDEMHALRWMLAESKPDDVVALTVLVQRNEVFPFLEERGATRVGPERVRELVKRARSGA